MEGTRPITAARTSGCGVIFCWKRIVAGTNEHYHMNTDNVVETRRRLKCWLGWWCHCVIAQNVCMSAVYESLNLAYERRIMGENL